MMTLRSIAIISGLIALAPAPVAAQSTAPLRAESAPETAGDALRYADIADLVLAAPLVVDATIRSTARIRPAEATGIAPGLTRFYVEADVASLIRGAAGLPPRIGYLLDVAPDSRGRLPKLKKLRMLLFARSVPGRVDQVQLVAPDAQVGWTPTLDARVRGVVREVVAADAPPTITGVGNAFHVAGALPGEGETQVFLTTADQRPVSLSILRRPGEAPRWAVALSEIVDEAAAPPPRDSLLWYRLACALPAALPERSTASLEPVDAGRARADYLYVVEALGSCTRARVSGDGGPA